KHFQILSVFFVLALFVAPVYAFEAFGASGAQDTSKDFTGTGTSGIANWPQKVQDYCKKAQDNAIKSCADYAERLNLNPGGWWVSRSISAKSFTPRNPPIDMSVEDIIVGKFSCPPHDLLVDREGKLVLQAAIHSEIVHYGKTNKTTGTRFGQEDESIEISCSFSCSAWPCIEYDPKNKCEDTYFRDSNGDSRSDDPGSNNGKTKEQVIDRIINGQPTAEGGYYSGLKLMCEGDEKIPWWKLWKEKKCKVTGCKTEELPYAGHPDTTILRTCCGCSCNDYSLIPSIDVDRYIPLTGDPFVEAFNKSTPLLPPHVLIGSEIKNKTTALIRDGGVKIPPMIGNLIGSEQVNVIIKTDDKTEVKYGFLIANGMLKEAKEGGYATPSLTLSTTAKTYDRIKNSKTPVSTLLNAYNDGSITKSSTTAGGTIKLALAGLGVKAIQIIQPPQNIFTVTFNTPPKQVTYEGYSANLIGSPKNIALIYPTGARAASAIAVNPSGSLIGYTNRGTQNLIASNPTRYSQTAGIYNQATIAFQRSQTNARVTIPAPAQVGYRAAYVAATAFTAQRAAITSRGSTSYVVGYRR
ncbi:MAG: hypothetical protein Q8R15_04935, partial [Candidatus Micrarchaeota archaeon]|nr:hypothetical protein [Candidatus Micrarchaeota archaeon]